MKTEFFVNKEKRVVVCKISRCIIGGYSWTFTSRAVCSEEDVFDEYLGKKLAEDRAHLNYHCRKRVYALKKVKRSSITILAADNYFFILASGF